MDIEHHVCYPSYTTCKSNGFLILVEFTLSCLFTNLPFLTELEFVCFDMLNPLGFSKPRRILTVCKPRRGDRSVDQQKKRKKLRRSETPPLKILSLHYLQPFNRFMKTEKSQELYRRGTQHLVGAVNSPVRAFKSVGGTPVFISHGKGAKIVDVDGNEYIDYVGSYGPLILGHAHPKVTEAVKKAAEKGFSFGASTEGEIELAEIVKEAFPQINLLRLVNSGTEAILSAIRLARAYTKKNKIIKFAGCYHGHSDSLLVAAGSGVVTLSLPGSEGVPEDAVKDTLVARYNDIESVKSLINQFPGEIAAVFIEPVAGNMGVVIPENNFLKELRQLTEQNGILLVIDEVMTGFRSKFGGAQDFFDVQADITCLGKVIGGGFPVGAYGGRKEIMEMVAPVGPVYQAGTLSGNPVAVAAGIATLKELKSLNPYEQFERQTKKLEEGMLELAKEEDIPFQVNRFGSMINPFFTDQPVKNFDDAKTSDTDRFSKFFWGCMENGIYLPPSQFEAWFLSVVHTDEDIDKTIDGIGKVLKEVRSEKSNVIS